MMNPNVDTVLVIPDDLPEDSSNIIDLDADNSDDVVEVANIGDMHKTGRYDDIIKDNKLMGEFIDKCLELDNSEGMERVINRSLIPAYYKTSEKFRCSETCRIVLTRSLCNLEKFPHFKFSHVKELCLSFKVNSKFVDRSNGNVLPKRTNLKCDMRTAKRQKKNNITEIVLSDDSDGFEVPIVNLDEYNKEQDDECKEVSYIEIDTENEYLVADNESSRDVHVSTISELIEIDKENDTGNVKAPLKPNKPVYTNVQSDKGIATWENEVDAPVCISDDEVVEVSDNIPINNTAAPLSDLDKLLVPHKEEMFSGYDEQMTMDRIKAIEKEIGIYKILITELEEKEVDGDDWYSPYILSDGYKAKIVNLYSQLCKLTGEKPVKRREVRLKAADKRLELPMKKLEEFINENIGSDGLPHFPDFCDVVACVKDANDSGRLGWSSHEVNRQARALFTHCGQALQRGRQRREWRDMLRLVKSELADPADSDPALMARLQANRRRAVSRETELLDRYSKESYKEQTDNSDEEILIEEPATKNNTINRVRIAPISVPSNYVTHTVNRIVHKKNQVLEIVVSGDVEKNNATCESNHENQTSNLPSKASVEPVKNVENNVRESSTLSACSLPFLHALATGSNMVALAIEVPHQATMDDNSTSSKITDPGYESDASEAVDLEGDHSNSMINDIEAPINDLPKVDPLRTNILDTTHSEDTNNASTCQVQQDSDVNASTVETAPDVKNEIDKEVNNNSDETNDVELSQASAVGTDVELNQPASEVDNSKVSSDILAHFLKARVVVPKMSIKYETPHSSDSNKLLASTDIASQEHGNNALNGTVENDEPEITIKQEPCVDIQKDLDELGDNFTTTIIDIQDPFLVIEISSDEDDMDDDEPGEDCDL